LKFINEKLVIANYLVLFQMNVVRTKME